MKWLSAGLTFVNISTIAGILLGMARHGLSYQVALAAVIIGLVAALLAYWGTISEQESGASVSGSTPDHPAVEGSSNTKTLGKIQQALRPYRSIWFWLVVGVFACFAFRSFCNLLFIDGNELKIQSPNNLGDLSLHLTYINNFASGVPLWPDNPIHCFSKLRYPAGIDVFNALLVSLHINIIRGLVWVGLFACAATCFALYRWGGTFAIAGFIFNGGLVGFQYFKTLDWRDYQGVNFIAWKSIALSMLVTQRGLLYAIPVGLLLLCHWRSKFFPPNGTPIDGSRRRPLLPFWVELSLYASMPLFHIHTFMALSFVLAFLFLFLLQDRYARMQLILLAIAAVLPATFFVWLVTDQFHAGSVLQWNPGWVQNDGDFARPLGAFANPTAATGAPPSGFFGTIYHFFQFWTINFGLTIPLIITLVVLLGIRAWKQRNEPAQHKIFLVAFLGVTGLSILILACLFASLSLGYSLFVVSAIIPPIVVAVLVLPFTMLLYQDWKQKVPLSTSAAFVVPAVALFLFAYFVKAAPWAWDNIKLIIWAYLLVLPFLWRDLISRWIFPVRALVCVALFGSGFVTIFGGIAAGKNGFGLINRAELDGVGAAVRNLPLDARFAAFPIYNHPLLLQGRKVILGYPGHVWTQGFNYGDTSAKLTSLMNGSPDYKEIARHFQTRYLFWGQQEKTNYGQSKRPWEKECKKVASGDWGAIYDLESPPDTPPPAPSPSPTPSPTPSAQ